MEDDDRTEIDNDWWKNGGFCQRVNPELDKGVQRRNKYPEC